LGQACADHHNGPPLTLTDQMQQPPALHPGNPAWAAVPPSHREARSGLALGTALRKLTRMLIGANPWPAAGPVGQAAAAVMALTTLVCLAATIPAVAHGTLSSRYFEGIGYTGDDFVAYLTGAALLIQGEGPSLYDPDRQLAVQRALLATIGAEVSAPNTFVNPPLWAATIAVLYPLGVVGSSFLWRVLSLAVSLGALLVVARCWQCPVGWRRAAALTLCFMPFMQAWQLGSMVALQVLAFGGWLALTRANRLRLAGFALSLLLLKPHYLAFPMLYLAWKGQWRQLQGLVAGAAIQAILTLLVFALSGGPPALEPLLSFATLEPAQAAMWVERVEVQVNLRAALWSLLPATDSRLLLALLVGVSLAATAAALVRVGRRWEPQAPSYAWEVLVVAAMTNLTAIQNHVSGLVFLLPPSVALLVPHLPRLHHPNWRMPALAGLLALPSLGVFFVGVNFSVYIASAWVLVLGALALGWRANASRR
jgi:hypothetical protein